MIINQFLFFALAVFCIIDHFQTVALINVGFSEANPIVLFITNGGTQWDNLLTVKITLLVICEILMLVNYYKKRMVLV